jgi:hypothetical protein
MANFCYDCTKDVLGVDPTWNDFARGSTIPEDEFWKVLCEGCGVVVVNSEGKKVDDILLRFSERIDEEPES